jgi:hypothetical protein
MIWWLIALVFPPVTLIYLYIFPFDADRPERRQRINDACFAAACFLYLAVPFLHRFLG